MNIWLWNHKTTQPACDRQNPNCAAGKVAPLVCDNDLPRAVRICYVLVDQDLLSYPIWDGRASCQRMPATLRPIKVPKLWPTATMQQCLSEAHCFYRVQNMALTQHDSWGVTQHLLLNMWPPLLGLPDVATDANSLASAGRARISTYNKNATRNLDSAIHRSTGSHQGAHWSGRLMKPKTKARWGNLVSSISQILARLGAAHFLSSVLCR